MYAFTGEISFTNSNSSAQDITVSVDNPLGNIEPDVIYDVGHNLLGYQNGVNISYNSSTNKIDITMVQVSASTTIVAEFLVVKRHSIDNGSIIEQATINSSTTSVPFPEKPDVVLVRGGACFQSPEIYWSYDGENVSFYNASSLTGDLYVDIIKFHSIQFNQNGITDDSGYLHNQKYRPDIIQANLWGNGFTIRNIDTQQNIDYDYDPENKTLAVYAMNVEVISIPIHSIFKG